MLKPCHLVHQGVQGGIETNSLPITRQLPSAFRLVDDFLHYKVKASESNEGKEGR